MILLQVVRIAKSFGAQQVLRNANLLIQPGERAGIVGVNGTGKSTLLNIITGALSPDAGEVIRSKNLSVSYLRQNNGMESGQSIWEEMLAAFAPLVNMEKQLRAMEGCMSDPALSENSKEYRRLLLDYDTLSADFANQSGFTYEAEIRGVLHGLNFREADYHTPVNILSGGQKTRLALARCLLRAPDLLILDEPTNYLDMDNLAWLEQYLQTYRGALLLVSHDRYFLDALVKVTYELTNGELTRYSGNYTDFVRQKADLQEQQWKAYKKQQEEISRMEEFVRRNMAAKDTTGRAQSRLKTLEKMERLNQPDKERHVRVSFTVERLSGREVFKAGGLTVGYPGAVLAAGLNFVINRGERVVLIGPNGIGKSTLLKTIAGLIPPLAGLAEQGSLVRIGYYEQEQQGLHQDKDVLHELWDRYPHMNELDIRKALGGFLFSGDDVQKSVANLSGGEKSRLALAALMLGKANFLLLDEPTNHLDLPGKEALENALADYPGTILFVSHDRYFINKIASRTLALSAESVSSYPGNYDYYQNKKNLSLETTSSVPSRPEVKKNSKEKEQYLQKKEEKKYKRQQQNAIALLEQTVAEQEALIRRLEKELEQPEVYRDYQACQQRQSELEQAKAFLQDCLEKWLGLMDDD